MTGSVEIEPSEVLSEPHFVLAKFGVGIPKEGTKVGRIHENVFLITAVNANSFAISR